MYVLVERCWIFSSFYNNSNISKERMIVFVGYVTIQAHAMAVDCTGQCALLAG